MAVKHIAIVYATQSTILRWKVVTDSIDELSVVKPGVGESILLVTNTENYTDDVCKELIASHTGIATPDDRCVVVKDNKVIDIIKADHTLVDIIKTHGEGHKLVPHKTAKHGDTIS